MARIMVEHFSVHKNQQKFKYEQAACGEIALYYDRNPHTPGATTAEDHAKDDLYWVPPEKAMALYELIGKDTNPDEIIKTLQLGRRSFDAVGQEIVDRVWAEFQGRSQTQSPAANPAPPSPAPQPVGPLNDRMIRQIIERGQVIQRIAHRGGDGSRGIPGGGLVPGQRSRVIHEIISVRDVDGNEYHFKLVVDFPGKNDHNPDIDFKERWIED